jgi:hypothetical protein
VEILELNKTEGTISVLVNGIKIQFLKTQRGIERVTPTSNIELSIPDFRKAARVAAGNLLGL